MTSYASIDLRASNAHELKHVIRDANRRAEEERVVEALSSLSLNLRPEDAKVAMEAVDLIKARCEDICVASRDYVEMDALVGPDATRDYTKLPYWTSL